MNSIDECIKGIEDQLIEVKYRHSIGMSDIAAIKAEYVKEYAEKLVTLLKETA